ncbi:MAG: DUF523 domain-containing protein [Kiritimatiellia bacterium]
MLRLFPIPVVVTSRCLGFDACRYDGNRVAFPWAERWKGFVNFRCICPEMDMGLGVPRPAMRLVQQAEGVRLMTPETGEDQTDRLKAFTRAWLDDLPQADGFILKEKSPSCGIRHAKRFRGLHDTEAVGSGPGLFAEAALERYFLKPTADEHALEQPAAREAFLVRLFASAALAQARRGQCLEALQKVRERYQPLVAAIWKERAEELDRLLAPAEWTSFDRLADAFEEGLLGALKRWPAGGAAAAGDGGRHLYPEALQFPG